MVLKPMIEIWHRVVTMPGKVRRFAIRFPAAVRNSIRAGWVRGRYKTRRRRRSTWRTAQLRALNTHGWLGRKLTAFSDFLGRHAIGFGTIPIWIAIEIFKPPIGSGQTMDHVREVYLACAGIAGTALALVLTLSITPAQRVVEAFSQAIVSLYQRDRALNRVFLLLGITCIISLLVGTGWDLGIRPRSVLGFVIFLMGISLDALRSFHARTIKLLLPETAIELVLKDCDRMIHTVRRHTEKIARIMRFDRLSSANSRFLRSTLFAKSPLAAGLRKWIDELDEFARKATERGDTQTAIAILNALSWIGVRYADARRASIFLVPDMEHILAGGQTEVNWLLDHLHGCIQGICKQAGLAGNELVVSNCIRVLGNMAVSAMGIIIDSPPPPNWRRAPLAYNPIYFLGKCVEIAQATHMQEPLMEAIRRLHHFLASIQPDVDTRTAEGTAIDILSNISLASRAQIGSPVADEAIKTMLAFSLSEIQRRPHQAVTTLRTMLRHTEQVLPFEVRDELAGARPDSTFPPYSLTFGASLAHHLRLAAEAAQPVDQARPWINPFGQLLAIAEALREHYRAFVGHNFQGALLIRWIMDSIISCCRSHIALIVDPPAETDQFIGTVEESLGHMIQTIGFFYRRDGFQGHADAATNGLTMLGMELLEAGRSDLAMAFGEMVATIASDCASVTQRQFEVADHLVNIEILARTAELLGDGETRDRFRALIVKPEPLLDEAWQEHLDDFAFRLGQLDDELDRFVHGFEPIEDPTAALREIRNRIGVDEEDGE